MLSLVASPSIFIPLLCIVPLLRAAPNKSVFHLLQVLHFTDLTTPLAEFWRSGLLLEKQLSSSDCRDSHSVYDVLLRLHPYLPNGGWFRIEIKVEFHKGAILLSTLLAVCWYHLSCSHSSVWCAFQSSSYAQLFFFLKKRRSLYSNGGGDCVSEGTLRCWRFVKLTCATLKCSRWNLFFV